MKLEKLLCGVNVAELCAEADYEVKSIKISSKDVGDHDLFLCMQGIRDDGNSHLVEVDCDFIAVTEKKPQNGIKYVLVDNVRRAYSIISRNFYGNPLDGMKFVSVIGTNGKTSTAHYIASILSFAGLKVGLIGTEGHYVCGEKVGESLTTPDPLELNALFYEMRTRGVDVVVSEVSAHAIYLEKLYGLKSDVSVLTNITQDHLDFFKDFETYAAVKTGYFTAENTKKAVINLDDPKGRGLARKLELNGLPYTTYGINSPADCFAMEILEGIDGLRFLANLNDVIVDVKSGLYGDFNVYNLLAALTVCRVLGVSGDVLSRASSKVKAVKGRFSVLSNGKGTVIIDYAHTPDGLENLLRTARTVTKSRLICVFGCGGERDRGKRPLMGKTASALSDFVIITSDNPRYEDENKIIEDITAGVKTDNFKIIADREAAIVYALFEMQEGDTVVIAGKGNEKFIDRKGDRIPFNDFDAVGRRGVR